MSKLKCDNCDQKFTDKRYLKQHLMRKNACGMKFTCTICHRVFEEERLLISHLKRKSSCVSNEEAVVSDDNTCPLCEQTYYNRSSLKRHLKTCKGSSDNGLIKKVVESTINVEKRVDTFLNNANIKLEKRIDELENEVYELKDIVRHLVKQVKSLTTEQNSTPVFIYSDENYNDLLAENILLVDQWIYFIKEEHTDDRIKIGRTSCMKKRLSNMQTGNSDKLFIIAYIKTDNMVLLEKMFHQHLTDRRMEGEWFDMSMDDIEILLDNYRETGELIELDDL